MTIYVVTSGEYSSYMIVGVFSSRELAESAWPGSDIEEYELDPGKDAHTNGLSRWDVDIRRDGTVVTAVDYGWAWQLLKPAHLRLEAAGHPLSPDHPFRWIGPILRCSLWAKDYTQAVKAANETRAQLVASGEWDTRLQRMVTEYKPEWWSRHVGPLP